MGLAKGRPIRTVALLGAVALAACGGGGAEMGVARELRRVARSGVLPQSINHSVVLLSDSAACVVDSYNVQVHCGQRDWSGARVIGRVGDGPGELRRPFQLLRGPRGEVGVVDLSAARLTGYAPSGEARRIAALPPLFTPLSPEYGDTVVGVSTARMAGRPRAGGVAVVTLSTRDGAVLERDSVMHPSRFDPSVPADLVLQAAPARSRDGTTVLGLGAGELAWYSPDGRFRGRVVPPAFRKERRSRRDVDAHREGLRQTFGTAPPRRVLDAFAKSQRPYRIEGRSMVFDTTGALWVATQRDRERYSYFDVFRDGRFVESVRIDGRILGFDVRGSVLAAAIETDAAASAVPQRFLDWYEIHP